MRKHVHRTGKWEDTKPLSAQCIPQKVGIRPDFIALKLVLVQSDDFTYLFSLNF